MQPPPKPAQAERKSGFLLARLFGVEVRLDWSLTVIFALVTINLGAGVLPSWHPAWSSTSVWAASFAAAVLFFASLLAHELSHAFVARAQGVPVNRVTLFLFGGVAHLEGEPPSARAEFLIAIVGPLTSLALGLLMTGAGLFLAGPLPTVFSTVPLPASGSPTLHHKGRRCR